MPRRQRKDLSVFESSCHLPTCLPHTAEASYCPFNCWTSSRKAVNINFYSLCYDPTGNRTRVYRFSSRRSIHSTTKAFWKDLLRCLGSQSRDTNVLWHNLMSSSRRCIKKHKQYTENNLMQRALSYRDAFRPCSKVSSDHNNTIYTSLKQHIHIVRLS